MRFITKYKKGIEGGEATRSTTVDLINSTGSSLLKMGSMGGFGYVVFSSGVILVVLVLASVTLIGSKILGWLLPVSASLLFAGFIFVVVERIYAYRMASIKLNMILSLTEKLVLKVLPKEGTVDTLIVRSVIKEVFSVIWGMDIKEPAVQTPQYLEKTQ